MNQRATGHARTMERAASASPALAGEFPMRGHYMPRSLRLPRAPRARPDPHAGGEAQGADDAEDRRQIHVSAERRIPDDVDVEPVRVEDGDGRPEPVDAEGQHQDGRLARPPQDDAAGHEHGERQDREAGVRSEPEAQHRHRRDPEHRRREPAPGACPFRPASAREPARVGEGGHGRRAAPGAASIPSAAEGRLRRDRERGAAVRVIVIIRVDRPTGRPRHPAARPCLTPPPTAAMRREDGFARSRPAWSRRRPRQAAGPGVRGRSPPRDAGLWATAIIDFPSMGMRPARLNAIPEKPASASRAVRVLMDQNLMCP